jgi:hypothetical protein
MKNICYNNSRKREEQRKGVKTMKKVKAIKTLFGENLPIEKMEILFVGTDYVLAKFKGYGFVERYAPCDGYIVEFENN